MGMRGRGVLGAALAAAVLGGCGGGSDDSGEDLYPVGFLPQDGQIYNTVDLAALKRGLDLPASTAPTEDEELSGFISPTLGGVYAGLPNPKVVEALDLPSATALAATSASDGASVTAVATAADPQAIREDLLSLGFVDRGGVLEGPDGKRANPGPIAGKIEVVEGGRGLNGKEIDWPADRGTAVRFEDDVILVSDSGRLLRGLGTEAREPPLQVQRSLDGDATSAFAIDGSACVIEQGIATSADGSGVLVWVVDGEPDASRFDRSGSLEFGEPEVEGDQLRIPLDLDGPQPPLDFQAVQLPGYECPE